MNTKIVIAIVVAVLVVGAGAWYAMTNKASTTIPTPVAPIAGGPDASAPTTGSGSIADLWGKTGTLECEISSTDTSAPFSGKVYVSGGKIRSDVVATIVSMGNKAVNSHTIRADGFVYTWTDLMPQGVKIAENATPTAQSPGASGGPATSSKVSYTCKPWTVDVSLFAPPSNITFMTVPGAH